MFKTVAVGSTLKRPYSQPRLSYFGNLAGMTSSGAGTKVEGFTVKATPPFFMICAGSTVPGTSMATNYPCI